MGDPVVFVAEGVDREPLGGGDVGDGRGFDREDEDVLATLAGSVLRGQDAVSALLERARRAFGMESAALLERTGCEQASPPDGAPGAVGHHRGRLAAGHHSRPAAVHLSRGR